MNNILQDKYDNLLVDYKELLKNFDKLKKDHDNLKIEYSENMIIQSMNDMKEKYDELVKTTVPTYKYEYIHEKWKNLKQKSQAVIVLLNFLMENIKKMEYDLHYNTILDEKKIEFQMYIMKELLEECIK